MPVWIDGVLQRGGNSLIYTTLVFAASGNPTDNHYLMPSYVATSANLVQASMPFSGDLTKIRVKSRIAPGGAEDNTFTIMLNGAPTAAVVIISGASTENNWAGNVAIAEGDEIAVLHRRSGLSALVDPTVTLLFEPT